jgi:membrane protein
MGFLPDISPWQLLKKLFKRIGDNDASGRAAQLSYYFVFALFPFLFFLVTLAAYLPVQNALEGLLARIDPLVPDQAMQIVRIQLTTLTTQQRPHLLTLGLALSLWSASRGVDALRASLNLSYDVKESRPWWKVQGIALVVTVATSALMLFAILAITLGSGFGLWLASHLHVDKFWPLLWSWLRWPITAVGIMLVLALLYYFLPDVKQEWRFITPGSVISTLLWLLVAWAFSIYAENFASYDKTYGAIGGVIVLMTWFYMSGFVFILGGEVNALLEHASVEGKAAGARAAGEAPPPPVERPSIAAPGAAKTAEAASRTQKRAFWARFRKSPA